MSVIRRAALGIGSYRVSSEPHRQALLYALQSGICQHIDTSPNYGDGASERLVGHALREWLQAGGTRSDVTVVTKVGVLQGADLLDAKSREARGQPWPGVVKISQSAWHCIAPEYITYSIRASKERLGLAPDVVLLHNPEFILADELARQGSVDADAFYNTVGDAFGALSACHDGSFGVSSNIIGLRHSVSGPRNDLEAVDLHRIRELADSARCNVVQLPMNLLEPDACVSSESAATPAANAQSLGFNVMSHRPLHAIPPVESLASGFGVQRLKHLGLRDTVPMAPTAALIRNLARDALSPFVPDVHRLALEDIALLFALDAPNVDTVLCGMRTLKYVERAAAVLTERAPLPPEAHAALSTAMQSLLGELGGSQTSPQRTAVRRGSGKASRMATVGRNSTPGVAAATVRSLCTSSGFGGGGRSPPRYVDLPSASTAALQPSADGGPLAAVGMSDRGMGLVYRAGRLRHDAASASARAARESREGKWLIKVQPPLDNSSDARGGIGRMTPATLLLHDATGEYCAFVREEEAGHSALLRCALRRKGQVAYLWAEDLDVNGERVVRVSTEAVDMEPGEAW